MLRFAGCGTIGVRRRGPGIRLGPGILPGLLDLHQHTADLAGGVALRQVFNQHPLLGAIALREQRFGPHRASVQGIQQLQTQRLRIARRQCVGKSKPVYALGRNAGPGGKCPGVEAVALVAIDIESDPIQTEFEHAEQALGVELVLGREPVCFGFLGQARTVLLMQRKLPLQLLPGAAVLLDFGAEALPEIRRVGAAPRRAPTAFQRRADQRQDRGEQDAREERDPLPVELGEEHREHQQHDEDERDQRWQQHAQ